jgi:hypothetical protein
MSPECAALLALRRPAYPPNKGDMWLHRHMGIVKVMLGHKKGTKRGMWPTAFHLYHSGKPSMYAHPCDFRENDPNASTFDPKDRHGHEWEYIGNIFDALPFSVLAGLNP